MTNTKNKSYGALIEGMQAYLEANQRFFNLDQLAGKAGISSSLLSRIVSRDRSITIRSFDKLLEALDSLGIDFSDYIKE